MLGGAKNKLCLQNLRRNIESFDLKERWTDAPIAIIQSGGIRSSINQLATKGKVGVGLKRENFDFRISREIFAAVSTTTLFACTAIIMYINII